MVTFNLKRTRKIESSRLEIQRP